MLYVTWHKRHLLSMFINLVLIIPNLILYARLYQELAKYGWGSDEDTQYHRNGFAILIVVQTVGESVPPVNK